MEKFDIFLWANEVAEMKNNVSVELFLFNKNYTPFKVRYSEELTGNVKALFMNEAADYVNKQAEKGLVFRHYDEEEGDEEVVFYEDLEKVVRAETLIHLVEKEYKDIDYFSDDAYEFKKIKGILAKFSYPGGEGMKSFYMAKGIVASAALKGKSSWELNGESFEPFSAELGIKMPDDNQVMIAGKTVVVFNKAKFEKLFGYDAKAQTLAEEKAKELMEKYKLSFAEGLTLDELLKDKKPLLKKVNNFTIEEEMSQEQVVDYADEMKLELMTDDDGSIIIMDEKDLTMFVNLVAEDYYVSPVNGKRYEIKSKKLLEDSEGEPPRG